MCISFLSSGYKDYTCVNNMYTEYSMFTIICPVGSTIYVNVFDNNKAVSK